MGAEEPLRQQVPGAGLLLELGDAAVDVVEGVVVAPEGRQGTPNSGAQRRNIWC
jgi:hypothetical protein